jgi:hypothetical protein
MHRVPGNRRRAGVIAVGGLGDRVAESEEGWRLCWKDAGPYGALCSLGVTLQVR